MAGRGRPLKHPPEPAVVVLEIRIRGRRYYVEPTGEGWAWLRLADGFGGRDGDPDLCASDEGLLAIVRAKLKGAPQGLFVSGEWPPKAVPSPPQRERGVG